MKENIIEVGSRVVLKKESEFFDSANNPKWGGKEGYVAGTVTDIFGDILPVHVTWDNGAENGYNPKDLDLLSNLRTKDKTPLNKTPLEETILMWEFIAVNGTDKETAIRNLADIGLLSKHSYNYECPLCDAYRIDPPCTKAAVNCGICPWKVASDERDIACLKASDSPYKMWRYDSPSIEEKQNAAMRVAKFVKSLSEPDVVPKFPRLIPGDKLIHKNLLGLFTVIDDGDDDDFFVIIYAERGKIPFVVTDPIRNKDIRDRDFALSSRGYQLLPDDFNMTDFTKIGGKDEKA